MTRRRILARVSIAQLPDRVRRSRHRHRKEVKNTRAINSVFYRGKLECAPTFAQRLLFNPHPA